MMNQMLYPLTFTPIIRNYIWGGHSLQEFAKSGRGSEKNDDPIAEIWTVYEDNPITNGPFTGQTLAELTDRFGGDLLGPRVLEQTHGRFPLLIKILDCARWLSLQVHPNDQQAHEIEGPNFFGKTEAWYILDAKPGAQLIAGIQPHTTKDALEKAIRQGKVLDLVEYHNVKTGETVFMPAGTIHALGPDLLVYEVQQTSDITYRVFDWNRPKSAGRKLHIEKSLKVVNPQAQGQIKHPPETDCNSPQPLVQSQFFDTELLCQKPGRLEMDTRKESFHALTVISGQATLSSDDKNITLNKFNSAVVPAACGSYQLSGDFRILKSSLSF
jgi:mannose-6-phosphate isomerase